MKSTAILRSFLIISGSSLLAVSSGSADNRYWDGGTVNIGTNGNGVSGGAAGNWNTTLTNWDQGNGLAHTAWVNTNLDTASFGGTAGAVTLTAPVTVGGLEFFSPSGYNITGSTLTLGAANNTIALLSQTGTTSAATITSTLASVSGGNVILNSTSATVTSTLTIAGTGGWSGTTSVNQNFTLQLNSAATALLNTTGITLNGGTIIQNATANADRISNSAAVSSNGGTIATNNTSGGNTYNEVIGAVTLSSGQTTFVHNTDQVGAGTQTLTLSGLTRTGATNTSAVNFASSGTLNGTKNFIAVTGAVNTTAGQIIGAWATTGNTSGANDYAIYSGGQVARANIAASAETAWTVGTDAYTLGASTTLTATRSISALRNTGATTTLTLATGANLETYGLLNGATTTFTVAPGTGGVLTTPTGGGQLHLNAGNNTTGGTMTVSAPINNNGGNVTVVKNGLGTLNLSSTTSNYSGGTVVNAGTLAWTANTNLGSSGNRNITVNGIATLNGNDGTSLDVLAVGSGGVANLTTGSYTFTSATGSGVISYRNTTAARTLTLGDASGFTGTVQALIGGATNANPVVQFSLIGDTAGSALQFGGGNSDGTQNATFRLSGDAGPVTFNNRQVQILPRTSSNHGVTFANLTNNNATAANTWIINTALLNLSSQTGRSLVLNGTHTGANAFNGVISDGNNGGSVAVVKNGTGTWALGGNNTHSGGTSFSAGRLNLKHAGALGTGTFTIGAGTFDNTSGSALINSNNNAIAWNGDATFAGTNSYDLGIGAATLGGNRSIVVSASTLTIGGVVSGAFNITLGGNGRLALTNEASTYTGKTVVGNDAGSSLTIQVSKLADLSTNSSLGAPTSAANGLIQLGSISRPSTLDYIGTSVSSTNRQIQIGSASNGSGGSVINNNSVSSSHTLTFSNAAFNVAAPGPNSSNRGVTLGGANTGDNTITGAIINNTGGTVAVNKSGAGTWVLNGTSSFTGAVAVNSGTLKVNSIKDSGTNSAVGAGTLIALGTGTTTGTLAYTGSGDSASRAIRVGSGTAGDTGGGVINNNGTGSLNFTTPTFNTAVAGVTVTRNLTLGGSYTGDINEISGAIVDNATGTGGTVSLTKNDASTWSLTSTSNSYTGATNVNGGTLLINGITSSTSLVSVASTATLGGTGTVGGSVSLANGATLAPGASIESLKTGALTMASGSTFAYEIADDSATGADLLGVGGSLSLTNVTLSLDAATQLALGGVIWTAGDKLTLMSYGSTAITSGFAGYVDDTNYTFGSNVWTFNYDDTTAGGNYTGDHNGGTNFVTFTAFTVIPEPRAALLGGIGLLMLLRRRR